MPSRPKSPLHRHQTPIIPVLLPSSVALLLLILLIFFLFHRRFRTTPTADKIPPHKIPFSLLCTATSSFSPINLLGRGGFGPVYKASHSLLRNVAVKVMDSGSLQGEREFHNELTLARKIGPSPHLVTAVGFSSNLRRRRMILVYDLMKNGNLQDALLRQRYPELRDWSKRLDIALHIARGIEYLHAFDPPIIHGDIKPSNVLLDEDFVARISDFGLARVKSEISVDLGCGFEETKKIAGAGCNSEEFHFRVDQSPENTDTSPDTVGLGFHSPTKEASEVMGSANSEREAKPNSKPKKNVSTRDWWWRQDNSEKNSENIQNLEIGENSGKVENGGVPVKEYVMDWIGTEVKRERPKSSWIGTSSSSLAITKSRKRMSWWRKDRRKLEWWASFRDETKMDKKKQRRPAREWWKEEFCEELAKKSKKKRKQASSHECSDGNWWARDDEAYTEKRSKKSKGSSKGSIDWWVDNSASGEILKSGGISSTPSMRGTVCYNAPEYGGGGHVSEKCDVYSYGVLLLVLVAGRRPLQVSGSPVSEFQRANLISWARHLARTGKLLDLIDESIQQLDREQAVLCVTVALLCLQKFPARRPSMKEVVRMLCGEVERPQLPVEFSSSPPCRFTNRSRMVR